MDKSNHNQRQQGQPDTPKGQPDTPNQGRHFHLKNGQLIPETEYQRRVREYRELVFENMPANKIHESRVMLETTYLAAKETLQSPEREVKQLRALFNSVITLHRYFIAWEDSRAKDMEWKRSIEAALREAVTSQTNILQSMENKLDELLNGKPESQGEMLNLVMGTLNDLRTRLEKVEASSMYRQPVRPKQSE